jgi:hypothetical protein
MAFKSQAVLMLLAGAKGEASSKAFAVPFEDAKTLL